MSRIREINKILSYYYGRVERKKIDLEPIFFLIHTILSQNTNDKNRDRAFENLIKNYKTADEILNANIIDLEKAIYSSGSYRIKARRIQECLREIKNRQGNFDLSFLKNMEKDKAMEWLSSLPGIGIKSAAVILNFQFQKNLFPVDTHIFRVTNRIGLINEKDRVKAQIKLDKMIPDDIKYEFHMNLIRHGREICKSKKPKCDICPIKKYCKYYNSLKI